MNSIFIYRDGQEYGPFTIDEVKGYLAAGNFVEGDYARTETSTEWATLQDLMSNSQTTEEANALPQPVVQVSPVNQQTPLQTAKDTNPKTSKLGITAFVLSLLSLTGCLFFLAIPGVILAHIARARGHRTGLTLASLIIGYMAFPLLILYGHLLPKPPSTDLINQTGIQDNVPKTITVKQVDTDNPQFEGTGNTTGNIAFSSLDDFRIFLSQLDQMNKAEPTLTIAGVTSRAFAELQHSHDLEIQFVDNEKASVIPPGEYKIVGVFDRKGNTTTLIYNAQYHAFECASDNAAPLLAITYNGTVYYMAWVLVDDGYNPFASSAPNVGTSLSSTTTISESETQSDHYQAEAEILNKVTYRAVGTVIQRLDNGYLVHVGLVTGELAKEPQFVVSQALDQGGAPMLDRRNINPADYVVPCNNPTLVDNDTFDQIVYYTGGVYSYTTALGVSRTVRVLAISKEDAIAALKDQIDARQDELVEATKKAAQEKADQEAQQESEFLDNLRKVNAAISNGQLDDAQNLLSAAEALKPGDDRLTSFRTQLQKAQFGVASKSFHDAILSGDIATALAKLNVAKELIPSDPSIGTLQTQLVQLKDQVFQGLDTKLAAGDVRGADKDYSDLAASFPDDTRLVAYKAKVLRAKFDVASKAFSQAIQSQDIEGATTKLNEAEALIPDDGSLGTLQKQLLEARWNKSSSALNTFLSNSELSEGKRELSELQNLNIEPEKTATLASQLADAIQKAINADVSRGKDALRSKDLEGAVKALADAKNLDQSSSEVLAFDKQIGDFKYASGMSAVAGDVSDNKLSDASDALDQVLLDRPDDPSAVRLKSMVADLAPIINAKQFMPDKKDENQGNLSGYVTYRGRVIAWSTGANANHPPAYVVCSNESSEDLYRVTIEPHLGNQWAAFGGKAPSIGASVLVFGGPVFGPFDDNDYSTHLGVVSITKHRRFSMEPVKILPFDFIEQQKSAIISGIKEALSSTQPH